MRNNELGQSLNLCVIGTTGKLLQITPQSMLIDALSCEDAALDAALPFRYYYHSDPRRRNPCSFEVCSKGGLFYSACFRRESLSPVDSLMMSGIIPAEAIELLQSYGGIEAARVASHIENIREKALRIAPYPCIQEWRFLELSLQHHFAYAEVIQKLTGATDVSSGRPKPKLLDLGCCVGQNLRRTQQDGVDAASLVGLEIEASFIEIGYDLFCDRCQQAAVFLADNLFCLSSSSRRMLEAQCDVIVAMSFFHLFNLEQQFDAAKRCVELLRDENGVMVLGRQVGSTRPNHYGNLMDKSKQIYLHSPGTFKRLWDNVGKGVGITWDIVVEVDHIRDLSPLLEDHMRWLSFSVTRTGRKERARL